MVGVAAVSAAGALCRALGICIPVGKDSMSMKSRWRADGVEMPERGWSNYISDKLAERNPAAGRYLRGRDPESVARAKGGSVSDEEWLMSPFFERSWWAGFRGQWSVGASEPPARGWSAHNGGRNQIYLDMHARWIRRDVDRY